MKVNNSESIYLHLYHATFAYNIVNSNFTYRTHKTRLLIYEKLHTKK